MSKTFIGIIAFLGISLVIVGIYFLVKKLKKGGSSDQGSSSSSSQITIQINLKGPVTIPSKTVNIPKEQVQKYSVSYFIQSIVNSSKIITWNFNAVKWKNISVNGKNIPIGKSEQGEKNLFDFLGNDVTNINISGEFQNACDDRSKPECDICKSQTAVCGDTSYTCEDNTLTTCPDREEIKHCCSGDTPYVKCVNGKITCETCPTDASGKMLDNEGKLLNGTGTCGDPTCALIGPVCTSNGWECQAGRKCPSDTVLATCPHSGGEIVSCVVKDGVASLLHSNCDPPSQDLVNSCVQNCQKSGLVCNPDTKKYECKQGVKCPTIPSILSSCCTDPNAPVAVCSDTSTSVTCKGCDGPKPECPEDCFGSGVVCTADGWKCEKGVVCPSQEYMNNNCCPKSDGPTFAHCDPVEKCVKCYCSDPAVIGSKNTCQAPTCGGKMKKDGLASGEDVCCSSDPPCNKPQLATDWICCSKERSCYDTVNFCNNTEGHRNPACCCPVGTICKGGSCVPLCGTTDDGSAFGCEPGETCLISENLSDNNIASLKSSLGNKVRINNSTRTAYSCMKNDQTCTWNPVPTTFPEKVGQYNPCYTFPAPLVQDPNNPGPGYCSTKDTTDIDTCLGYSDKYTCDNISNPMTQNWTEYTSHSTFNIIPGSDNYFDKYAAFRACQDNPSCRSVVKQPNPISSAENMYTLRAGYIAVEDDSTMTAYIPDNTPPRNNGVNCKWVDGLCTPNSDKFNACKAHSTEGATACNSDGANNCAWRYIFDFMAENPSKNSNIIRSELGNIEENVYGNCCHSDNNSFQRVGLIASDGGNCTPLDCWKHIGQSGITDVEFREASGGNPAYCIYSQNCLPTNTGITTSVRNSDGSVASVTPALKIDDTTNFPECSSVNTAPLDTTVTGLGCKPSGKINRALWKCADTTYDKTCSISTDGTGYESKEECERECCSPPLSYKDGKCYYYRPPNSGTDVYTTGNFHDENSSSQWNWLQIHVPKGVTYCTSADNSTYTTKSDWKECDTDGGCVNGTGWYLQYTNAYDGDNGSGYAYCDPL